MTVERLAIRDVLPLTPPRCQDSRRFISQQPFVAEGIPGSLVRVHSCLLRLPRDDLPDVHDH